MGGRYAPQSDRSKTHLRPPKGAKCSIGEFENVGIFIVLRRKMGFETLFLLFLYEIQTTKGGA